MDSFDLRQGIIPFSLLEITNHFKRMLIGQQVEIIVDDARLLDDLKQVLPRREYRMTDLEVLNCGHQGFRTVLTKEA